MIHKTKFHVVSKSRQTRCHFIISVYSKDIAILSFKKLDETKRTNTEIRTIKRKNLSNVRKIFLWQKNFGSYCWFSLLLILLSGAHLCFISYSFGYWSIFYQFWWFCKFHTEWFWSTAISRAGKTGLSLPVFYYWSVQGFASVVIYYHYHFSSSFCLSLIICSPFWIVRLPLLYHLGRMCNSIVSIPNQCIFMYFIQDYTESKL